MSVAVLGCGPAGLMAALAARSVGKDVAIFSRKRKSPLYGAQYLHEPIPEVTNREDYINVQYVMKGSPDAYRRKVYGRMWDGTVSPEDLDADHKAWDIRETYDRLWTMFERYINNYELDPAGVRHLINSQMFEVVINTIPLNMLCLKGHRFGYTEVVAAGDAPGLGIDVGRLYSCPQDTVICNGEEIPSWYRVSNIFGHTTVEWPGNIKPPVTTASKVVKPTSNNCDCYPNMLKVGRYGSWTKGVLSHSAYFQTLERMNGGPSAEAGPNDDASMPTLF